MSGPYGSKYSNEYGTSWKHKGLRTRRPSRYSGYVPWYVPEGAEFDTVDTEGYNPHVRVLRAENRFSRFDEFLTTLEDFSFTLDTYHPEEYEEEYEGFHGAPAVRPVLRHAFGLPETEPAELDLVEMYRRLEGKDPPAEAPPSEPIVPMCRSRKHIKPYKGPCMQCKVENRARSAARKREERLSGTPPTPSKTRACRICGDTTGHDARNCPQRRCDFCGKLGHGKDNCPARKKLLGLSKPKEAGRKRGRKPGQSGHCSVCGTPGHTVRTCPRNRDAREAS